MINIYDRISSFREWKNKSKMIRFDVKVTRLIPLENFWDAATLKIF